jgi:3-deoxy-7-phosphoheptulonate synthase
VKDKPARRIDDVRIEDEFAVASPHEVLSELPVTESAARTTFEAREAVRRVLEGDDGRAVVVVGPCSIHDPEAALDYAGRLAAVRERLADDLLVIMRVYFEKPRTTVGWKGLINDPDLDGTFRIDHGLRAARRLLLDLNEMGVPSGVEFLDVFTPQYFADLVAWGAIGARTTESQVHRQLASGLSCPVGFKNGTAGNVKIAVDAIGAARSPHHFLGVTKEGRAGIFRTTGNLDCHVILRGGDQPNYGAEDVAKTGALLEGAGLPPRVMIDFSHANSLKQHERQLLVGEDVASQIAGGDRRIVGVMIESNLVAGRQDVKPGEPRVYGQSITDACLGWEDTEPLLERLAAAVRARRRLLRAAAAAD